MFIGTVPEYHFEHRILVPPAVAGTVTDIIPENLRSRDGMYA